MKIDLKRYARMFREGVVRVAKAYPVETALAIYACVCGLLTYELDWVHSFAQLNLVPIFFVLALAVNNLAGCGPWRKVYWVCWVPIVPLSLWAGLGAWIGTTQHVVTLGILAPLALLASSRAVSNDRFVSDAMIWLRSLVLAELFANVALGLFYAILYSTTYIFGLEGAWIRHVAVWAVTICESLAVPMLFLMMADRWRGAGVRGGRVLTVLLDYIVAPALLIYTAILYLYAAKILVMRSLPEGGVAYLVFGFTMTALIVKALRELLTSRRYGWFFDRFSLVSLVPLALFWVGVARRVGEYGLTVPRVWLLVCGGLMTLCVLLFLSCRTGRYLWVCIAGFVIFASVAYVPAFAPEPIAVRSQLNRTERLARHLELLDDTGAIRLEALCRMDSLRRSDIREFYEAADYVADRDSAAFARFGVEMRQIRESIPPKYRDYVVYGWELAADTVQAEEVAACLNAVAPFGFRVPDAGGYSELHVRMKSWTGDGTPGFRLEEGDLHLRFGGGHPDAVIPSAALVAGLLRSAGIGEGVVPDAEYLQNAPGEPLVYRDEELLIVFSSVTFESHDTGLRVSDAEIDAVLTR